MSNWFVVLWALGISLLIWYLIVKGHIYVLGAVLALLLVLAIVLGKEQLRRRREGFYVETKGNADGGDLIYHEGDRSLTFYFDRPARTIYVPADTTWAVKMPDWARSRKSAIVHNIQSRLGASWRFEDKTDA